MNAKEYRHPADAQAFGAAAPSTAPHRGTDAHVRDISVLDPRAALDPGTMARLRSGIALSGPLSRRGASLGRLGTWTTVAAAAAAMSLTSGCAWTLVSAADAVGSMTQAGFAVASQVSSPTYVNGAPLPVKHVCIEINNQVNLEDLVPALRVALASRGVTSMVYNAGNAPPDCESRLTYTASMDYGHREFSDGYSRYLSTIDLRLVHGNEIVVAHYQTEGLNVDRFATTSTKMRGLVRRMVVPVQDTKMAAVPISRSSGYMISTNGATSYSSTEVMAVPMQDPGASPLPNPVQPQPAPPMQANPYSAMQTPAPASPANGYVSPYTGTRTAPAANQPAQAPFAGDAPQPAPATAPANPYGTQSAAWKPKGITSTSP